MGSNKQLRRSIRGLSPGEFEHFLADIWEAKGYTTSVRGDAGENDMGVDIDAVDHREDESLAIQAKRYTNGNKVGGPEVQQYAGLRPQEDVDRVLVVTTSEFTDQARDVAEEADVELLNLEEVEATIQRLDEDARGWLAREWDLPGIDEVGYKPAFTSWSKITTGARIWAAVLAGPCFTLLLGWQTAAEMTSMAGPLSVIPLSSVAMIISFIIIVRSALESTSVLPKVALGTAVILLPTGYYIRDSGTIAWGIAQVFLLYGVFIVPLLVSFMHVIEWRNRSIIG